MGLADRMLGLIGLSRAGASQRERSSVKWSKALLARFDAAQTTAENRNHWKWADGFSADAALSSGVRKIIRERARYEIANNSYAKGIVATLANDLIGTGPRLQLIGLPSKEDNQQVERRFGEWAKCVRLAQKLRTASMAEISDGEVFILKAGNDSQRCAVKLCPMLVECDQITDVVPSISASTEVDGISYDAAGNPVEYTMLDTHPGASFPVLGSRKITASKMLHYFRADRPGQRRGVSKLVPSLPLFAMLRRFTLATVIAAETAAKFAAVMETNGPAEEVDAGDLPEIEIERGVFVPLPDGRKMSQLKAEHPATTYPEFVRTVLIEIARCLNMPINIAMGDSSEHSYAGARMDQQTYFLQVVIERTVLEEQVLDDLFESWLAEAVLIEGYLPKSARMITSDFTHDWYWDGREHVDPAKEASADDIALRNHSRTLAEVYGRKGKDWQTELRQSAIELAYAKELGLFSEPSSQPTTGNNNATSEDEQDVQRQRAAA